MNKKVIIVTGGSQGIGKAIALKLANENTSIAITYAGNKEKADDAVSAIVEKGARASAFHLDLHDLASIKALFESVNTTFGRIDVLVSNAYGQSIFKPHVLVEESEFDLAFGATKGTFFLLQEGAKQLNDDGSIVAISTGGTAMATPAGGLYAGSKAAIEKFAFSLAKELGDRRINVNVVSPGVTKTESLVAPQEMLNQLIAQTPFGRLGSPEEVAGAVAMLVGEEGEWINMQNIGVNGGIL